jgi:fructan beta-fructosidase
MKSKLSFLGMLLASGKMNNTMKSILTVACMLLKSAWQAVSLRLALATLLLVPLVAVHAADAPPLSGGTNAVRELTIEHPYLHLPIKKGAPERRVRFVVDGKLVRDIGIELAEGEPDFVVFSDVSAFKGQKLRIETDPLPKPATTDLLAMLDAIVAADEVPGAGAMYQEKYRPQFHFSPRRGWVGDPNGLVFYKGEYHLFFQHNPFGLTPSFLANGNDHWGHAVSKDLIHWQELPIALYPHRFGDWPFSGSCVVDWQNTAGFKTGSEDSLVIVYPSTGRGICIAYSNDRGRTFTEYTGNPLKGSLGGDPRIFWHEPTKKWVIVTGKILKKDPALPPGSPGWLAKTLCGFEFYTSQDLKNWERQSGIEDYWECPDLFELPVDGDSGNTKWILLSNQVPSLVVEGKSPFGRYSIGTFEGKSFTEETGKLQLSYGNAYSAAQSYNNIPAEDGRRINVGCAFGARMPGMPFEQMLNFPTELTLRTTEEGPRLFTQPVREIQKLYTSTRSMDDVVATPEGTVLPGGEGDLFDITGEFAVGAGSEEVGFKVRGVPITYDVKAGQLTCAPSLASVATAGDRTAPLQPVAGKIKIRFLLDRASIEIFANDGRVYMPMAVVPKDSERSIAVFAKGEDAKVTGLTVHALKSAWLK